MKKIILIIMLILCVSSVSAWVDRSRSFVYDRVSQDSYGNINSNGYHNVDNSFEWNGRFWAPDYDEEWDEETSWNMHNEQSRLRVYEDMHTFRPGYRNNYYNYDDYYPNQRSSHVSSYYPNYYSDRFRYSPSYDYRSGSRLGSNRYTLQSVGLYRRGKYIYQ